MSLLQKYQTEYGVKHSYVQKSELNERTISAIGNTYNYFDSDADVLRKGCALKSIKERGVNSSAPNKIMHLKHHDITKPVGKFTKLDETTINGFDVLYFESKLSETEDGEELRIMYNEGIYNQHSIGFQYVKLDYIDSKNSGWKDFLDTLINPEDAEEVGHAYNVTEIKLYEISTVSFGANSLTPFLGIKSSDKSIMLTNIYSKMDSLFRAAKQGSKKEYLELQYKQLKQLINELSKPNFDAKCSIVHSNADISAERQLLLNLI